MDANQLGGQLRLWVPMLLAYLVARGYLTPEAVGPLGDLIVAAILAIVALGAAIWSYRENSKDSHIQKVEDMHDVKVLVGPQAPAVAQAAAEDPKRMSVVPVDAGSKVAAEQVSNVGGKP